MTQPSSPEPNPNSSSSPHSPRRFLGLRRWQLFYLLLGGAIAIASGIGYWRLRRYVYLELTPQIEQTLAKLIDRPVEIGAVEHFSPVNLQFGPSFLPATATDADRASVAAVNVRFNPLEVLLRQQLSLSITLVNPDLVLQQDHTGQWLQTRLNATEPGPIQINLAQINFKNTTVTLQPFLSQPSLSQPSLAQPSLSQPSLAQPSLSQPSSFIRSRTFTAATTVLLTDIEGQVRLRNNNQLISLELGGQTQLGGSFRVDGTVNLAEYPLFQGRIATDRLPLKAFTSLGLAYLPPQFGRVTNGFLNTNVSVTLADPGNTTNLDPALVVQGRAEVWEMAMQLPMLPQPLQMQRANMLFQGEQVNLRRVKVSYGNINAIANGQLHLQDGYDLTATVPAVAIDDILAVTDSELPFVTRGNFTARLRLTGELDAPALEATVINRRNIFLDQIRFDTVQSRIRLTPESLEIGTIEAVPHLGGSIQGGGTVSLEAQPDINLTLALRDIPADDILRKVLAARIERSRLNRWWRWVDPLTGEPLVLGPLTADLEIEGRPNDLRAIAQFQAPEATFPTTGEAFFANQVLSVNEVKTQFAQGRLNLGGRVDFAQQQWQVAAEVEQLPLNQFPLGQIPWDQIPVSQIPRNPLISTTALEELTQNLPQNPPRTPRFPQPLGDRSTATNPDQNTEQSIPSPDNGTDDSQPNADKGDLRDNPADSPALVTPTAPDNPSGDDPSGNDPSGNDGGDRPNPDSEVDTASETPDIADTNSADTNGADTDSASTNDASPAAEMNGETNGETTESADIDGTASDADSSENPTLTTPTTRIPPPQVGQLDGRISAAGTFASLRPEAITLNGQLQLSDLPFLNQPLSTVFEWTGTRLRITDLSMPTLTAYGAVDLQFASDWRPIIGPFDFNLRIDALDLAEWELPLVEQIDLAGVTDFDGRIFGTLARPNVDALLQFEGLSINQIAFESLVGPVRYSPDTGVFVDLQGDRDRIAAMLDSDYRPVQFALNYGVTPQTITRIEGIIDPESGGDRLQTQIREFPLSVLNLDPAPQFQLGTIGGTVNADAVVDLSAWDWQADNLLDQLSLMGTVAIAQPSFGYLAAECFEGTIQLADGVADIRNGQLRLRPNSLSPHSPSSHSPSSHSPSPHSPSSPTPTQPCITDLAADESRYTINGRLVSSPTPAFKGNIAIEQGRIQDWLQTLQFYQLGDLARGLRPIQLETADDITLVPLPFPASVAANPANTTLLRQLQRYAEIVAWREQQRRQQQTEFSLPQLQALDGTFSGNIDLTAALDTGLTATFDLEGRDWQWGPYNQPNQLIAQGEFANGTITFLPLRFDAGDSQLNFAGSVGWNEDATGQFQATNLSVDWLRRFFKLPLNIDGNLDVTAAITGNLQNPQARGN
ncbi:MAG: DUF748 domain-containing protein, partial [Cyanothece sp. SIO2G6]|nr:DUF748 domain-containing protein [Cyanothece sp. SIO2G6]